MTRVAAIDCGTNTILLLVADASPDGLVAVEDHAEIVRLGEGLDSSGHLRSEAIDRTLARLDEYLERIKALACGRVGAVGTEALRKASNGNDFVAAARARLSSVGGYFRVIDGPTEARLAWSAVAELSRSRFGRGARHTVVDIGGGSTELLVGGEEIDQLISLPIGSVRLTERILRHDPPTVEEQHLLVSTIERALDGAPAPEGGVVGIAGTVTTLAAMSLGLHSYDGSRVQGSSLGLAEIRRLADLLGRTPVVERSRMPGLDPRRADVIYAGAVLLERILSRAGARDCLVSDQGIRWGLARELAAGTTRDPDSAYLF